MWNPRECESCIHVMYTRGEFVLVEGVKNGREELEVLPPLIVYSEDGQYTEAMKSIFRELSDWPIASAE